MPYQHATRNDRDCDLCGRPVWHAADHAFVLVGRALGEFFTVCGDCAAAIAKAVTS